MTFDKYTDAFSLAFDIDWPYDDQQAIIVDESAGATLAQYKINPVFEEHIRDLGNWKVGPQYSQQCPALGEAVKEDVREFSRPTLNS